MKAATSALIALLQTRQFYIADLYTFTFVDGSVLRYCSGDADLTVSGHVFKCGGQTGPYIERSGDHGKVSWKTGLEVDTLQFSVIPGAATVFGLPLLQAARLGKFDGAELQLDRAYMPTYGDVSVAGGTLILFIGRVAEIDMGRTNAVFNVNSHLELLDIQMPRNLYQAGCVNTLYDTSCTLLKSAFTATSSANSGSTQSVINTTMGQASGYFDLGGITFTSGQNAGFSRSVKAYVHGGTSTISVITPFPFLPAPGDTFTIYPGCDKTQNTCGAKFSNIVNFRGMPYVPEPETAI